MKDTIIALLSLSELDLKMLELRTKRDTYPREVTRLQALKKALLVDLNEYVGKFKDLQVSKNALEQEVATNLEGIKKHEEQLNQVKDNESYKALQNEINTAKDKNSHLEEKILDKMEQVENSENSIDKKKKDLKSQEDDLNVKEKECHDEVDKLDAQIKDWMAKREEQLKAVDTKTLDQYEKILIKTKDTAIVSIEGQECGGCHMRLSPQLINETMSGLGVQMCPDCSRMLYCKEKISETT